MLHERMEPPRGDGQAPREDRQVTVLVNAAIVQAGRDGLCRIRNVSAGGLAVETQLPLTVGAAAEIGLRSGRILQCVVRWTQNGRTGLSCAEPADEVVLAERGAVEPDPMAPVYPRFERRVAATVALHGQNRACAVHSLSTADIILFGITGVEPGAHLGITVPGLGSFSAVGRLSEGDELLAGFVPPIPFRLLDGWLATTA